MRRAAAAAIAALLCSIPAVMRSQAGPAMVVAGPASNPIRDAVATFSLHARGFSAVDLPLQIRLQVSQTPTFEGELFADTTVSDTLGTVIIPRLLPAGQLFWRAFALTARGGSIPSVVTGPRTTSAHLVLLSPNSPAGQSLDTPRPTFVWRSTTVPAAFGRWDFDVRIEATGTGQPVLIAHTDDTTFVAPQDLESNASYRWRVRATLLPTGETVEAASAASFVIRSSDAPVATLLYRTFPNPFPAAGTLRACIWFDLRTAGNITLDVLDLNGHRVRRIAPAPGLPNPFAAGRYGRPQPGAGGCDDRFTWDGTDDRGRTVNGGIYLIRLTAGGTTYLERTLFNGR